MENIYLYIFINLFFLNVYLIFYFLGKIKIFKYSREILEDISHALLEIKDTTLYNIIKTRDIPIAEKALNFSIVLSFNSIITLIFMTVLLILYVFGIHNILYVFISFFASFFMSYILIASYFIYKNHKYAKNIISEYLLFLEKHNEIQKNYNLFEKIFEDIFVNKENKKNV